MGHHTCVKSAVKQGQSLQVSSSKEAEVKFIAKVNGTDTMNLFFNEAAGVVVLKKKIPENSYF